MSFTFVPPRLAVTFEPLSAVAVTVILLPPGTSIDFVGVIDSSIFISYVMVYLCVLPLCSKLNSFFPTLSSDSNEKSPFASRFTSLPLSFKGLRGLLEPVKVIFDSFVVFVLPSKFLSSKSFSSSSRLRSAIYLRIAEARELSDEKNS